MGIKMKKEKALGLRYFPWLLGFYIILFTAKVAYWFFFGLFLDRIPFWLLNILLELFKWGWI